MAAGSHRRRRLATATGVLLIVVALPFFFPGVRRAALRQVGALLVVSEPAVPSDCIVIAIDARVAGALDAADLSHAGISKCVAVFADPPDEVDQEYLRRGIKPGDMAEVVTNALHELGVPKVETIALSPSGTEDEGRVLPQWAQHHNVRSILIVSTPDHSRRLERVMRRATASSPLRVTVYAARHSTFDPDNWWENRGSLRTGIVELEKLLLDVVRHPLS